MINKELGKKGEGKNLDPSSSTNLIILKKIPKIEIFYMRNRGSAYAIYIGE